MTEMINRVARAICVANLGEHSDADDHSWQVYIPEARAAIAAMRDPMMSMIHAITEDKSPMAADAIAVDWRAMIDEALRDG